MKKARSKRIGKRFCLCSKGRRGLSDGADLNPRPTHLKLRGRLWLLNRRLSAKPHQRVVKRERYREAHKPRIIVERPQRRNHESNQSGCRTRRERDHREPIEATRVFVDSASQV